jgi:hypothetical protein
VLCMSADQDMDSAVVLLQPVGSCVSSDFRVTCLRRKRKSGPVAEGQDEDVENDVDSASAKSPVAAGVPGRVQDTAHPADPAHSVAARRGTAQDAADNQSKAKVQRTTGKAQGSRSNVSTPSSTSSSRSPRANTGVTSSNSRHLRADISSGASAVDTLLFMVNDWETCSVGDEGLLFNSASFEDSNSSGNVGSSNGSLLSGAPPAISPRGSAKASARSSVSAPTSSFASMAIMIPASSAVPTPTQRSAAQLSLPNNSDGSNNGASESIGNNAK